MGYEYDYKDYGLPRANWDEFWEVEEAQFHQFVAEEVRKAGLGIVEVTISQEPDNINPNLRKVHYRIESDRLTVGAFDRARRFRPRSSVESGAFCWLPGVREEGARQRIQEYARYR